MIPKGLSAIDQRIQRIQTIIATLQQSKAECIFINYDRLIFETQMRYGLTEMKAREYVELAIKSVEAHKNNDGEIVWNK